MKLKDDWLQLTIKPLDTTAMGSHLDLEVVVLVVDHLEGQCRRVLAEHGHTGVTLPETDLRGAGEGED